MIPVCKFWGALPSAWDAKYRAQDLPSMNADDYLRQPYVQTLLRHLRLGMTVLDAGCGTGGLLRFLRDRDFSVAGVDTSDTAIDIAKKAVPDADLRVASIEQLPYPDASFDAYLAIGSWEYPAGGPERAAKEAVRVLKPRGLAFIEVPQLSLLRRTAYVPLKHLERSLQRLRGRSGRFSHFLFSVGKMQALLDRVGFEVLGVHPHDLPELTRHYGLWVDWPPLRANPAKRGARSVTGPYELNSLGLFVKRLGNALSPWTIATGMYIVARKK